MARVDLFAVQPRVGLDDYTSEAAFAAHHRALAARVAALRDPARPALAVWPEYVGTFLALAGHAGLLRGCRTTRSAMTRVALRRLPGLVATMARHRVIALTPALLTTLSPQVHGIYARTFAGIARDFDLWVVAGSALLPRNRYGDTADRFAPSPARVYNTSYLFDPSGRLVLATRKVNLVPTQEDVLGLTGAPADELAVVDTPFGPLGTAVCYDAFHEPHTGREPGWTRCLPVLDRLGALVVAQPSANAWAWDAPWAFNGPGEALLRREQWFTEGAFRELAETRSVRWCVNPQLVGTVLDNTFEGPSMVLERRPDGTVGVLAAAADPRAEDVVHATVPLPVVSPAPWSGRAVAPPAPPGGGWRP